MKAGYLIIDGRRSTSLPGPGEERGFNRCNAGSLDYIAPYIFVGDLRGEMLADYDVRQTGTAPAFQPRSSRCVGFTEHVYGATREQSFWYSLNGT